MVVTDPLVGLCERGPDLTRPILVVIDGAEALCWMTSDRRPTIMPTATEIDDEADPQRPKSESHHEMQVSGITVSHLVA